jgi:hypothetical protein
MSSCKKLGSRLKKTNERRNSLLAVGKEAWTESSQRKPVKWNFKAKLFWMKISNIPQGRTTICLCLTLSVDQSVNIADNRQRWWLKNWWKGDSCVMFTVYPSTTCKCTITQSTIHPFTIQQSTTFPSAISPLSMRPVSTHLLFIRLLSMCFWVA